jgi:hypothetical protein
MPWYLAICLLAAVAAIAFWLGRRVLRCEGCGAPLHSVCLNQRCGGRAMAGRVTK